MRRLTLAPPPKLNLVEWADTYRYLSPESSSTPGRWKTDNVEAARGPMLAVTEPGVRKITVMGPTQLLKTELINNIVGYFISQDPSPMIVMQPKKEMAESWSKDRLAKMLRDTPILHGRVKDGRGKNAENTILHKSFPGGQITMVGSNSPTDLASRPVRVVLCDEVDKYPRSAGSEGDPIKLIEERSDTFWNALSVRVCSPTIKGRSRIEEEYELSDKRVFHGKCPHCGKMEELKWEQVAWDDEVPEATARYICSHCDNAWTESERLKAISKGSGRYIATAPFTGHAGFKCNKLASPWQPVSVLVRKYLEAGKDPEKLKTFYNTQLAETWEEVGEVPDYMRLYERRETWAPNTLQPGIAFLTAGVDVQKDRIEAEIVGWCRDKQSYSVDYRVIMGETAGEEPWKELDKLLNETWLKPDGQQIQLRMLAIDSGYNTQHVYNWVRKHQAGGRVRATKGQDQLQQSFGLPKDTETNRDGQKIKRAVKVWPIGSSHLKSELYGWLQLSGAGDDGVYPAGFCHFPQYDEEHFLRLCSEQLIQKVVGGKTVQRWVKKYERNEQLDCRVMARAAAAMFGIDRFGDNEWDQLLGKFDVPTRTPTNPSREPSETAQSREDRVNRVESRSSFWDRQRGKKLF